MFDVVQFLLRQGLAFAETVIHQETVALHDGDAVVGEIIELVFPLAVGEFDAVQPVAADQMRHAGNIGILIDGYFTAAVQFQLFEVTGPVVLTVRNEKEFTQILL